MAPHKALNPKSLLIKSLKELDLPLSENQADAFISYLGELKKWNRTHNLTALKTDREIVIKHFVDSLLFLRAIPDNVISLADVGSGAGFPGIPIKIMRPDIEVTLIEPTSKKAAFLRNMVRILKSEGLTVLNKRLEELGKDYEERFDLIVSRATFGISKLLEISGPYLSKNGLIVMSKGPKVSEEIDELTASDKYKNTVREIISCNLPFEKAVRKIVVLGH